MPIKVLTTDPVIFSSPAGGGPGEYNAPVDSNGEKGQFSEHTLDFVETMAGPGTQILAAWYCPLHNISHINSFHLVDVAPRVPDARAVILKVAASEGGKRVRIRVYALIEQA